MITSFIIHYLDHLRAGPDLYALSNALVSLGFISSNGGYPLTIPFVDSLQEAELLLIPRGVEQGHNELICSVNLQPIGDGLIRIDKGDNFQFGKTTLTYHAPIGLERG